jgi:hypothetical protein
MVADDNVTTRVFLDHSSLDLGGAFIKLSACFADLQLPQQRRRSANIERDLQGASRDPATRLYSAYAVFTSLAQG